MLRNQLHGNRSAADHDMISNERGNFLQSIWNWQPKKDYLLLQLISESNIHGLKYITQPHRHITERLFWITVHLFTLSASAYLGYIAVDKLNQSPVILTFQPSQTTIGKIPFPAVTICNVNLFRKSSFKKTLREARNETLNETEESQNEARIFLRELDHICDASMSFSTKLNYSLDTTTVNLPNLGIIDDKNPKWLNGKVPLAPGLQKRLQEAISPCEDMIPLCLWEDKVQNCTEIFGAILTDLGICCTFNMMPQDILLSNLHEMHDRNDDPVEIQRLIKRKQTWEKISIDFNIVKQDSNVQEKEGDSPKHQSKAGQRSGLSLLLNPHLDEYFCSGHDSYGFRIYPHSPMSWPHVSEFGMAISPNSEAFLNLVAEITLADEGLANLHVTKRHCYYTNESKLEFYSIYTSANCVDECTAKIIMQNCTCFRFDFGHPTNLTNWNMCEGTSFDCSQNVIRQIGIDGNKKYCGLCLQSCNLIEYKTQTSTFEIKDDINIWSKNGYPAKWAGKNVSIVHIFFGANTVYSRIRKRLYGFTELFGSVGGILGLFLGFSVMSLVEPVYFMIRLWIEPKSGASSRCSSAKITQYS